MSTPSGRTRSRAVGGLLAFAGYVASIFLANWLLLNVGQQTASGPRTIPVWFGVDAPSGVLAAGATLTLRDVIQRLYGIRTAASAVVLGAVLSAILSPALALASGVAFLLAEALDMAIYTPLRRRYVVAVVLSNIVGSIVDSVTFLALAFGASAAIAFAVPSVIGKFEASVITLGLVVLTRSGVHFLQERLGRPTG